MKTSNRPGLSRRSFLASSSGIGASLGALLSLSRLPAQAVEPFKRSGRPRFLLSLAAYSFRDSFVEGNKKPPTDPAKRIDRPLAPLDTDDVEVSHQEQRFLFPVPLEARDEIASAGLQFENFRGDALARQDGLEILRAFGFVARRIARIDFDEIREDPDRLVSCGGEVRNRSGTRVRERGGSGKQPENQRQEQSPLLLDQAGRSTLIFFLSPRPLSSLGREEREISKRILQFH